MYNKNLKNYYIGATFLVGVLLLFIGLFVKVNNDLYVRLFLLLGFALQLKALFMFIYKYGGQLKKILNK